MLILAPHWWVLSSLELRPLIGLWLLLRNADKRRK